MDYTILLILKYLIKYLYVYIKNKININFYICIKI